MYQKRHRTTFNQCQLRVLEEAFKQNSYPTAGFREALATKTNLDVSRVQVWFQNRRAKRKKQMSQAIRFAAVAQHHRPPLLGVVPQQTMEQHCAALQQQMALDLHLNTALGGLQQQQQQQQHSQLSASSPATTFSGSNTANGIASSFMDQVSLYGSVGGDCAAGQLVAAGGPNSLDSQLASVQNEDSNNLLCSQHWLTCSNALNQQQQQDHHHQQHQQIFDNLVNQQVINHSQHQEMHHHHHHDQLQLSNSSLSSTTSTSSQNSLVLEAQCSAGQQQQQQQHRLQTQHQDQDSLSLGPNERPLGGISTAVIKLETQNFHGYDQQRQQQQPQQHSNYYKQINSLSRSTVDYLH